MKAIGVAAPGIYAIVNDSNGRCYVGSAANLHLRSLHHRHRLIAGRHRNRHLQNAWNQYGCRAFRFVVLLVCGRDDLLFFEQRALDYLRRTRGDRALYNIETIAGSGLGRHHSAETKRKIGLANQKYVGRVGRKWTDAQRAAFGAQRRGKPSPMRGRTMPDVVRAKISATLMGHGHSLETRTKIGDASRGRKSSDDTKAKLRAKDYSYMRARHVSPETRAKISLAKRGQVSWMAGRKHTEETKAKMRAAKKRRLVDQERDDPGLGTHQGPICGVVA